MTKAPRGPEGCTSLGILTRLGILALRMTFLSSDSFCAPKQPMATGRHTKKGCA